MNSQYSKMMSAFAMMAMCQQPSQKRRRDDDIDYSPTKVKPIPKGCRRYYFDMEYNYWTENNGKGVFNCDALTEKHAFKKYLKWIYKFQKIGLQSK